MRLKVGSQSCDLQQTKDFVEFILKIGDDTLYGPKDGEIEVKIRTKCHYY